MPKKMKVVLPTISAIKKPKIFPTCEYTMHFDGCSKCNPGPAGIGAVIYKNREEVWGNCKYIGDNRTNNEAEYCALILGLEELINNNIKTVSVCGDSLLVINQINGIYKVKSAKLFPLYEQVLKLKSQFDYIDFNHVYRENNKRADELANLALQIVIPDDELPILEEDWDQEHVIEKMLRK